MDRFVEEYLREFDHHYKVAVNWVDGINFLGIGKNLGNMAADFTYRPFVAAHGAAERFSTALGNGVWDGKWNPSEIAGAGASTLGNSAQALTNLFGWGVGGWATKGVGRVGERMLGGRLAALGSRLMEGRVAAEAGIKAVNASKSLPVKLMTGNVYHYGEGMGPHLPEQFGARMTRYLKNLGLTGGNMGIMGLGGETPGRKLEQEVIPRQIPEAVPSQVISPETR